MSEDPVNVNNLISRLASGWGLDNPIATARIFGSWEQVVGPEVSRRCRPTSLRQGILKVKATSPAWATEIKYLAPELIRRVNLELGADVVSEVKVWVDPTDQPGGPSKKVRRGPNATPGPLEAPGGEPPRTVSTGEVEAASKMVSQIPDPKLAEATKKALLAGKMRRRRG